MTAARPASSETRRELEGILRKLACDDKPDAWDIDVWQSPEGWCVVATWLASRAPRRLRRLYASGFASSTEAGSHVLEAAKSAVRRAA